MKVLMAVLAVLAMAVPAMAEDFLASDSFLFTPPPVTNVIQPVTMKLYFNDFLLCETPYVVGIDMIQCPITLTSVHVDKDSQTAGGDFRVSVIDNLGRETSSSAVRGEKDIQDFPTVGSTINQSAAIE